MAEKNLSWKERLKAKAAQAAEAAKKAGGAIKDKTESGVEAVKESGAGENLKERFADVVEGGTMLATGAINKFKEVDWEAVGGKMKDFAEGTADWTKEGVGRLDQAIKSDEFQTFLENAGDTLEEAKPLGGAIKDSLGDMVDDPEAMKKILGGAVLTGGANIPYVIAQEVMNDPEVQGTFSELVDGVLPEGMENNVDNLLALSNTDLAKVLKDPSMTTVLEATLQRPEIQAMLKDKVSELTLDNSEIDLNATAVNDAVNPDVAPSVLGQ